MFVLQISFYSIRHLASSSSLLSFPVIPTSISPFLPPSIHHPLWSRLHVNANRSASVLSAGPGEELADEHILHGGVPCQLPAVRVVSLVRMFSNMWPHRLVCPFIIMRLMVKESEIDCPSCLQWHPINFSKVESRCLSFQNTWDLFVPQISSGESGIPSPHKMPACATATSH